MKKNIEYLKFVGRRFFGIELEIGNEIPIQTLREIVSLNSFVPVKTSYYRATINNSFWEVKHDGSCGKSVDKFGINEGGYEVTSFKGYGIKDIVHIGNIAKKLKQAGCQVNRNCGLHIHVDVSDFSIEQMGVLIGYWLCIEKIIMQAVPNVRKNNKFCNELSKLRSRIADSNFMPIKLWNHYKPISVKLHDNFDRRCAMNLVNFYRSMHVKSFKRPTVEFRFPEGTLVPHVIKNWTRILVNFVNKMKNQNLEISSFSNFGLKEALEVLGLSAKKGSFAILSPGLHESKAWFLRRILRYAAYPNYELLGEARALLDEMEVLSV